MKDTFVEDALRKAKLAAMLEEGEKTINGLREQTHNIANLDKFGKEAILNHLHKLQAGLKTNVAIYEAMQILNKEHQ